jgi:hypothetical protein
MAVHVIKGLTRKFIVELKIVPPLGGIFSHMNPNHAITITHEPFQKHLISSYFCLRSGFLIDFPTKLYHMRIIYASAELAICFMLVSCLLCSATLNDIFLRKVCSLSTEYTALFP